MEVDSGPSGEPGRDQEQGGGAGLRTELDFSQSINVLFYVCSQRGDIRQQQQTNKKCVLGYPQDYERSELSWISISQSLFYFMSVHSEVTLDNNKQTKVY